MRHYEHARRRPARLAGGTGRPEVSGGGRRAAPAGVGTALVPGLDGLDGLRERLREDALADRAEHDREQSPLEVLPFHRTKWKT